MKNKKLSKANRSFINFTIETELFETLQSFLQVGSEFILEKPDEAKSKLLKVYNDTEDNNEFIENHSGKMLDLYYHEASLSRMIYIRAIDNFTTYFKDILAEIVRKKPEILRSKEAERLDFILTYSSMDDLLNAISEKKIDELFYKGINDIDKFFKDRLGVNIFKTTERSEKINILIKQRNLVVHNRGKISKEFLTEFPNLGYKENYYLDFKFKYVTKINKILYDLVNEIDHELTEKFKLDEIEY